MRQQVPSTDSATRDAASLISSVLAGVQVKQRICHDPALASLRDDERRALLQLWDLAEPYWVSNEPLGHGPDHALRVLVHACRLARARRDIDLFSVIAASCLVDTGLDLERRHSGHAERSRAIAEALLSTVGVTAARTRLVTFAVAHHSASVGLAADAPTEAWILRDSDLLDRFGYPGVRMTLKYGQFVGRPLFNDDDPACLGREPELDAYSLDYVRHLLTLPSRLALEESIAASRRKIEEISNYLDRAAEGIAEGDISDYGTAHDLLDRMEGSKGTRWDGK